VIRSLHFGADRVEPCVKKHTTLRIPTVSLTLPLAVPFFRRSSQHSFFYRWLMGRKRLRWEQFRQWSEEYKQEGLAAPFRGITTNYDVMPGLFQISPSGLSTEPVRNAAEKFIVSLNNVQLAKTTFPVDDIQWRKWMNQHFYVRQGISMQDDRNAA
jgi:hypothetical protein